MATRNRKYKYVHVFWHQSLIFDLKIVEMIYHPNNSFAPDDHLFVTPYEDVYNAIVNMEYVNKEHVLLVKNSLNLINKLENLGDWFILHSLYVRKSS